MTSKLKSWDEMTPEQQERLRQMFRCETCRFTYEEVDEATREAVLHIIEQDKIEPFHSGESLHCWDDCYLVGSECYQLFGAIGQPEISVHLIEDNCPEKGPIHETYRD